MKRVGLLLLAVGLLSSRAFAMPADNNAPALAFHPVDCSFKTCRDKSHHGDLTARYGTRYGNGKPIAIISDGLCVDNISEAQNPKISPDGQVLGALVGSHLHDSANDYYYGGTRLLLFRKGRLTAKIAGDRYFIEAWYFWNNGRQIVLRSRAAHGVGTVELHDAATGKLISRVTEYKVNTSSPAWARKVAL